MNKSIDYEVLYRACMVMRDSIASEVIGFNRFIPHSEAELTRYESLREQYTQLTAQIATCIAILNPQSDMNISSKRRRV